MLISLSYYPPGCQHYRKSVFEKNNMISIYFKILKFLHTYQWSNHIVLPTEATGEIPPKIKKLYKSLHCPSFNVCPIRSVKEQ